MSKFEIIRTYSRRCILPDVSFSIVYNDERNQLKLTSLQNNEETYICQIYCNVINISKQDWFWYSVLTCAINTTENLHTFTNVLKGAFKIFLISARTNHSLNEKMGKISDSQSGADVLCHL
jgi:hypothetical protein